MISGEGLGPREGTGLVLGAGSPEGRPQTGASPKMALGGQASGDEHGGEPREGSASIKEIMFQSSGFDLQQRDLETVRKSTEC